MFCLCSFKNWSKNESDIATAPCQSRHRGLRPHGSRKARSERLSTTRSTQITTITRFITRLQSTPQQREERSSPFPRLSGGITKPSRRPNRSNSPSRTTSSGQPQLAGNHEQQGFGIHMLPSTVRPDPQSLPGQTQFGTQIIPSTQANSLTQMAPSTHPRPGAQLLAGQTQFGPNWTPPMLLRPGAQVLLSAQGSGLQQLLGQASSGGQMLPPRPRPVSQISPSQPLAAPRSNSPPSPPIPLPQAVPPHVAVERLYAGAPPPGWGFPSHDDPARVIVTSGTSEAKQSGNLLVTAQKKRNDFEHLLITNPKVPLTTDHRDTLLFGQHISVAHASDGQAKVVAKGNEKVRVTLQPKAGTAGGCIELGYQGGGCEHRIPVNAGEAKTVEYLSPAIHLSNTKSAEGVLQATARHSGGGEIWAHASSSAMR